MKELTREERVKELKRLLHETPEDQLIPKEFKDFHELWERIDELVGRSTYTHELAFPDLLYEEILTGKRPDPGIAIAKAIKLTKSKQGITIKDGEVSEINLSTGEEK